MKLTEMTLKQLWELFSIILKPHDPIYFKQYEAPRASLAVLFSCGIKRIKHIGSTAVPDLISKPIVDILLELNHDADINALKSALISDNWLIMSDIVHPELRISFNKGYTESGFADEVYHLHAVCSGDHDELYFRDYLIAHPNIAAEYGQLKHPARKIPPRP